MHESEYFFVVFDLSRLATTLPDRYPSGIAEFFALCRQERQELPQVIVLVRSLLDTRFKPAGYYIGTNCIGGQTVMF